MVECIISDYNILDYEKILKSAIETLSYSQPDMYIEMFRFIIDKEVSHYTRKHHEQTWTKTKIERVLEISVGKSSVLECLGIVGKLMPFNKTLKSINIISLNDIIQIPLLETSLYGLEEKNYGFRNSTLYHVDSKEIVLRIPKHSTEDSAREYTNHIIRLINP
ncbi:MAG: hypothetical protein ACP5NV_01870 [Candidatus Woesearchaeota archaeon]